MHLKDLISGIENGSIIKDTHFKNDDQNYKFFYEQYIDLCNDYGKNAVNNILSDIEQSVANGIYDEIY